MVDTVEAMHQWASCKPQAWASTGAFTEFWRKFLRATESADKLYSSKLIDIFQLHLNPIGAKNAKTATTKQDKGRRLLTGFVIRVRMRAE